MSEVTQQYPRPIFPVADRPGERGPGVPWAMIAPHEAQAMRNHSQSLKTLAGRGGLSYCEALAILQDRQWQRDPEAKAKVLAMTERWKARDAGRIEKAAIVLWQRFAPDHRMDWEDESRKAEFRDAARAALEAALA